MRAAHVLIAGLALAGCGGAPSQNAAGAETATANASAAAPVAPDNAVAATAAPAASPQVTKLETKDYSFAYSYPAAAAAVAPLAAWLDADRDRAREALGKETAEARQEAQSSGFEYRPYDSSTEWKVVTETPRLLSLSAETYDYTGGAHGSPGFRSLVWDKAKRERLAPVALFTSAAAVQAALGDAFCKALDVQRSERRGEPVVRSEEDPFSQCPKVEEATLILGSSNRRAIDRLGLLVGPYVAGAYAEGSYDITLPVTPAVLKAVKPEYRGAFAVR